MRLGIRIALVLVIIACCAMLVGPGRVSREQRRGAARFFIPGELGRELRLVPRGGRPANEPDAASPGFLTRAFSGLRGKEGAEWGRQNGLTPSLSFSHNLTNVFPPALFREKPEFFPLVEGKRLEPPKGSYFWNPDIAREDAAIHAAGVARKHFETHPEDVSFALGVNDALVWGESPELLALLGGKGQVANGKSPMANGQWPMAGGKGQGANGQGAAARPPPNEWFRGRPDYSNVVFTFMNRAAAELSRTHPDKYLGALAYYWCENVPDFPLHPQVVPFLTADRSQGYDPAFWQQEMDLQTKWGRLSEARGQMTEDRRRMPEAGGQTPHTGRQRPDHGGQTPDDGRHSRSQASGVGRLASDVGPPASGVNATRRLGVYDYLYGAGFIVPRVHTQLIADHLRHASRAGFTDYYAEVNPNWGLDGPMPWLTAQLLQDPEQSREALLDEYYERYFQHAAEPMRRFFEKCEQQWMAQKPPSYWLKHFRNESQAALFPPHIRGALRLHLTEAEVMAASRKVRERVRLVSDAFGLTERFCDFNEARAALSELLAPDRRIPASGIRRPASGISAPGATDVKSLDESLARYLDARREYIRHALTIRHEQPLAVHPVNHDDFLRNNPGFAAAVRLLEASTGDARVVDVLRRRPESWLHVAADFHEARAAGRVRELLPAGSLEGPLVPGRRIAGLQYGADLPAPWQSRLEPTETHEAAVTTSAARTGAAGLRISGAVNSTVYQWVPVTGGRTVVASGFARARVSPSNAVTLTLGWLDAQHRPVGAVVVLRIPDGEWPDWLQLMQGARAPANAAWAGLGIRVQNQLPGDWVEFDDLSLLAVTLPE